MQIRSYLNLCLAGTLGMAMSLVALADEITVYAAASLTEAMTEMTGAYERSHGVKMRTSFAASSALAKQIEQGAPADVFISADTKWMDYLDSKGKIDHRSRVDWLGNALVLVAPKGKGFPVRFDATFDLGAQFQGNWCTGQTESVPVGIYAKEALQKLGWWSALQGRLVGTEDVRASLNLVERGECDLGVVYATDAKHSAKVDALGEFPADLHSPVVYPMALITQAGAAKAFLAYMLTSEAAAVLTKHGFKVLATPGGEQR